jgi:UDP-N-acetylglucosamine diphosphorylase/glucosamine-1-phosphate N-acetyltransferase
LSRGLVVFEDDHWSDLRPLTDLVAVPELAFGASDLATRWALATGAPLLATASRALGERRRREPSGARAVETVWIANAAVLPGPWVEEAMGASPPALFTCGSRIAGALLSVRNAEPLLDRPLEISALLDALRAPRTEVEARVLDYPWRLIEWNAAAIEEDLAGEDGGVAGEVHATVAVLEPRRVSVAAGAVIDPLAVLDGRAGPIRIESGVRVQAHTLVIGPCVVRRDTHLLGGSIARSTIGPQCRIAGEVEESVWQGFANKRHHGFVGHSLIGEWVNLGALTTTSDLKNNYGSVRVWIAGREVDSGTSKIGAMIGGHVKTGIGTLLPTGASIGVGSNLFGGGRFAPKRVPPFSWWDGERIEEHRFEAFLATTRIAMSRRGRELGREDETSLAEAFAASAGERVEAAPPHPATSSRPFA